MEIILDLMAYQKVEDPCIMLATMEMMCIPMLTRMNLKLVGL